MGLSRSSVRTLPRCLLALSAIVAVLAGIVAAAKSYPVGIDLGTTYSCVAVYRQGRTEVLVNDQGGRITPSWVSFGADSTLVGEAAKNQQFANPANTIYDAKRIIGRHWDEDNVQKLLKTLNYKVVKEGSGDMAKPVIEVTVDGKPKTYAPEFISSQVLRKMKETAEAALAPAVVDKAVVTVPAYFGENQRQATIQAARLAGLTVERTVDEPTAAAIAYALDKKGEALKILVYDLGGGTFDVTVLEAEDGLFLNMGVAGNDHLGGRDFDEKVLKLLFKNGLKGKPNAAELEKEIRSNPRKMAKLQSESEKAKRLLSESMKVDVILDNFFGDGLDFEATVTRAQFNKECSALFKSTLKAVQTALDNAGLKKGEIDHVVLVGGSTRIPQIQLEVQNFFGKEPFKGLNPDEAVCQGAAIQANVLHGEKDENTKDILLVDVTSLSLGIETVGGVMTKVIPRSTQIPTKKSQIFSTYQDNQSTVSIKVYEGERAQTTDNKLLGEFDLSGIPAGPRGQPQIEVTFELDANSVLAVAATEKSSGKSQDMKVKPKSVNLSDEEIEELLKEAEKYAEKDKLFKEKTEAKGKLEGLCFTLQGLVDGGEVEDDVEVETLTTAAEECTEFVEETGRDPDATAADFNEKREEIEENVRELVEKYKPGMGAGGVNMDMGDEFEDIEL